MRHVQGTICDRSILYIDIVDDLAWFEQTKLNSWATYIIADEIEDPQLLRFAELSIDKNLVYMTATGKAGSQIDDLFDGVFVSCQLRGEKMPEWYKSEDDILMTSWHDDFAEGFWFITTLAKYEEIPIKTVLVVNFTSSNRFDEIQELTTKIRAGWLPSK